MKTKIDVVMVLWEDSSAKHSGWESTEDFLSYMSTETYKVLSTGFLAKDTKDVVILLQNLGDSEYMNTIMIPKKAIIRMKTLKRISVDIDFIPQIERRKK